MVCTGENGAILCKGKVVWKDKVKIYLCSTCESEFKLHKMTGVVQVVVDK